MPVKEARTKLLSRDGKTEPWTVLGCQVGNHSGVFPITKTERGWACPEHGGKFDV